LSRQPQSAPDEPPDLLDEAMRIPLVNAGVSRLRRVLGPSCLASLVILMLLTVLFRRWVHLPPVGLLVLLLMVWVVILGILVRFRNADPDGDLASGESIDRQ
jgi:TRAP-type C4-dicarboxylate transport system permease small subunit